MSLSAKVVTAFFTWVTHHSSNNLQRREADYSSFSNCVTVQAPVPGFGCRHQWQRLRAAYQLSRRLWHKVFAGSVRHCDPILSVVGKELGKEKMSGQPLVCLRRAAVGIGLLGEMTLAISCSCGKSLRFRVAINAVCSCSAQAQNGLSLGSGEISLLERTSATAASSLSRLMTCTNQISTAHRAS